MNSRFENSAVSRLKAMPATCVLIAVNILVFAAMYLPGQSGLSSYLYERGANYWPAVFEKREYYRILTCAFLHRDLAHIACNMLVLGYLGGILERSVGSPRYTAVYLLSAAGAGLTSDLLYRFRGEYVVSIGASGAVFGVAAAVLVLLLQYGGRKENLSIPRLLMFLLLSFVSGASDTGIDMAGHAGGFLAGLTLGLLICRTPHHAEHASEGTDSPNRFGGMN